LDDVLVSNTELCMADVLVDLRKASEHGLRGNGESIVLRAASLCIEHCLEGSMVGRLGTELALKLLERLLQRGYRLPFKLLKRLASELGVHFARAHARLELLLDHLAEPK
jgi:hypothetical protein